MTSWIPLLLLPLVGLGGAGIMILLIEYQSLREQYKWQREFTSKLLKQLDGIRTIEGLYRELDDERIH